MDFMDSDQVHDVPDTPDRLATRNIKVRGCMEKESDSSMASHSVNTIVSDEADRIQLRGRSKLVIDNGNSKRLSFHPAKNLSIPKKTAVEGDIKIPLGNSSSSKNAHLFRRVTTENTANHESKYPLHSQRPEKGKALCTSQSFPRGENAVLDLTRQNGSANGWPKAFVNRASGNRHRKEIRRGPTLANDISTLQGIANSSAITHVAYKGKEKVDDTCRGGSGIDRGKGSIGDSQPKSGKGISESIHSFAPPKVSGQKRLVRNGCISPHNTAKANRVPENHSYVSTDVGNDKGTLESDCSSSLIGELVAEDYNSPRGKGVISHLVTSKEHDTKHIDLSTRHSVTHSEVASGTSNADGDTYSGFEGLGRWRTTHTRTQKINHSSSDEGQLHPRTKNDYIKRQKQGPLSSNHGETSTSTSVDTEIVFLGSSREPSNSRSTRNQNSRGPGILDPVIEIDEFSPRTRRGCHNVAFNSNSDSDDRARQLEVDEMLARELQEQLYSEVPAVGGSEMDAHIALALQQEGTSHRAFSSASNPVFRPGSSVLPNTYRQSQPRSSHDPSIRRGARVRGPNSTRLTRLRRSLPRHSPRITQRERSSLFPPDMDMNMRIHILEALEAFSDMGGTSNFLEVEHEFNENDYETLLALDENNYQHGGASLGLINRLPQSTVQGDNFEEPCAICLDTPSSGDTIRHLPCLHKFHKDCIDPWLRRRTSCPICKSSIT